MACKMKPDIICAPTDDAPPGAGKRRVAAEVERTREWLADALKLLEADDSTGAAVVVGVPGGRDVNERKRAAAAIAELCTERVIGVAVSGLTHGYAAADAKALLSASVAPFPARMLRMVHGFGAPDDVLRAVACGVDVFDGMYPLACAVDGYALVFPLTAEAAASKTVDACADADIGSDACKLNLRAGAYREDARPLVEGCTCLACARPHSRAYIHHLLNVHELLGEMLLEAHNAHHYSAFFRNIRGAVATDSFPAFADAHFAYRDRWWSSSVSAAHGL